MEKIDFSTDAVTSEKELREIIGTPHEYVVKKEISMLDDHCKKFISMSPLFFLSTSGADGRCDVSPRGDFPNNILVLNNEQLVLPNRPGNKRVDSFENILSNPHVGLVFLIPGLDEVLRINGKATIINNKEILEQMSLNGKPPLLGIGVDVEECYIHCSRALKKSSIWNEETWKNKETLPSSLEIFHAHLKINGVDIKK
ncbi:PPOX class probable FMN-dependent enzyme [Cytobacillus eiseniae]|uniref:PPOX class probable FMN-dependent enzyme n=1 Tax=Cytobacillus eiseniae TaxID=762947 RepID=A0ABS4RGS4_9BACI|nr:MSMEG_1061 family FMN-dependent PPOX-type flavoprotein [Cytobacillus eiseniae]MBP2242098.1 PPOX class probable FMN-dependent enzyme [Cytobacillus eiseniae]